MGTEDRWYRKRAATDAPEVAQAREERGWEPFDYLRYSLMTAILGGIAGAVAYAAEPSFGALVLSIVGLASGTMWAIGTIAMGVQVGRRWP